MQRSSTILLIGYDEETASALTNDFRDRGFRVVHASDGRQGVRWARAIDPDVVLLAAQLPQRDGFAVCRSLRQQSVVPIIMLGPTSREEDRIQGLEAGADDYLDGSFSHRELLARIRAVLRRRELDRRNLSPSQDQIAVGDILLDRTTQQVWQAGELVEMPQREFDVLRTLMEHAGEAVRREELLARVWGPDWYGYRGTLSVHIYRLRQKLGDDFSDPRYIETVRSYGYRFVALAFSANGRR